MTVSEQTFWVVIPAAGIGSRMQADCPKQYLELLGKTVIEQTLAHFSHHPRIHGIVVAVAEHDATWPTLNVDTDKPLYTVIGGAERCDSVLNALNFLKDKSSDTDWVLVHDAARPCLRRDDLDKLMITMAQHPQGGILAVPVRDTLKRVDVACIIEDTVDREQLWHALTPQMFHVGMLREALEKAIADDVLVTDEASAMEYAGYFPLVVEGHADNIKITRPEDLALARFHLASISDEAASDYDGLVADDG
jgi:2-C-methyl-D-erythritol 4-phosphate cytidylyltransferase